LIDLERLDINTLGAAVNSIIKKNLENELSAEDTNTQKKWEEKANVLLAQQLALKELVITEEEKDEIQTKIKSTVTESVLLGSMSDDDHRKIQGYADGINTIISDATGEDHRGDLTTAVNVGITEDELVALTETRAETKTKLNQYFWNTNDRRVWEGQLEDTEVEIAEHMLGMPDENMTAVATVISGLNKTYIPIFNPTSRLNDQPAIIKNPDGQFDVVLAGKDNTYAGVTTQDNLDQLSEAKNLFYHLTRTDTEMITFEDDMGLEFDVKDFSNISSYTLSNGTVISTPSSTFGIYTMDPNNMVPANKQDYRLLREKVADYFPNIEVISNIDLNGVGLTLSTLKDNTGIVILNGTAFYISP
jgi:hypothetical protein